MNVVRSRVVVNPSMCVHCNRWFCGFWVGVIPQHPHWCLWERWSQETKPHGHKETCTVYTNNEGLTFHLWPLPLHPYNPRCHVAMCWFDYNYISYNFSLEWHFIWRESTASEYKFDSVLYEKLTSLSVQASFKTGRCVYLTSHGSGKSLRIVDKRVNGLGGRGKKGELIIMLP